MVYDVIIIGGGPGGFAAAQRIKQHGGKVLIIEKEQLGGVCLNKGCIPTKTLLYSAEVWKIVKQAAEYGISIENATADYRKVVERKNNVVAKLRQGMMQLAKNQNIEVIHGEACLENQHEVKVTSNGQKSNYTAKSIIIATGSESVTLPITNGHLIEIIDSDGLLAMNELPNSVLIIGGGAIGIEFASILNSFGCQVSVVEMMPHILPTTDADIRKRITPLLKKNGINIFTNSRVENIEKSNTAINVSVVTAKGTEIISCEKVLCAVGRQPAVNGLGLEKAGVIYTKKGIAVDLNMRTNVDGIYAIGDVTGSYMWAHAAVHEGYAAADHIMRKKGCMDYHAVPGCIFTNPEIASVGFTEDEAKAQGLDIAVRRSYFAANGKAVSAKETDGFVKLIINQANDKIIGMHIMGPQASNLIMEGTIATQLGLSVKDFAHVIHPHPTLSETVGEVLR